MIQTGWTWEETGSVCKVLEPETGRIRDPVPPQGHRAPAQPLWVHGSQLRVSLRKSSPPGNDTRAAQTWSIQGERKATRRETGLDRDARSIRQGPVDLAQGRGEPGSSGSAHVAVSPGPAHTGFSTFLVLFKLPEGVCPDPRDEL